MMKCLYFLLFVAASQAFVARDTREAEDIPAPRLVRITLLDDPSLSFKIDWTQVSTSGDSDPIEGYKLKVWEQSKGKKYRYETVNGNRMLVSDYSPAKFSDSDEEPSHKPRVFTINGVDNTSARVNDIESGVTYEARVLAFTKNGDGPLSQPMRIQVSQKDDDNNDSYNRDDSNHRDDSYQRDDSNQRDVYTVE